MAVITFTLVVSIDDSEQDDAPEEDRDAQGSFKGDHSRSVRFRVLSAKDTNFLLFKQNNVDHKLTELMRAWLEAAPEQRDYNVGALYLFKLSGNAILYTNLVRNISRHREFIEYQLQKYYDYRVQELTHEEVEQMASQAEQIVHTQLSLTTEAEEHPRGRRTDHDSLPDEVQALYRENLSLLRRMREVHLQLRKLSLEGAPCPDSERYPFLKELIALDKRMHSNWERYDHYTP
jgi:hypothetical protein